MYSAAAAIRGIKGDVAASARAINKSCRAIGKARPAPADRRRVGTLEPARAAVARVEVEVHAGISALRLIRVAQSAGALVANRRGVGADVTTAATVVRIETEVCAGAEAVHGAVGAGVDA